MPHRPPPPLPPTGKIKEEIKEEKPTRHKEKSQSNNGEVKDTFTRWPKSMPVKEQINIIASECLTPENDTMICMKHFVWG